MAQGAVARVRQHAGGDGTRVRLERARIRKHLLPGTRLIAHARNLCAPRRLARPNRLFEARIIAPPHRALAKSKTDFHDMKNYII